MGYKVYENKMPSLYLGPTLCFLKRSLRYEYTNVASANVEVRIKA
jgi:hypothetical protein